MNDDLRAYPVQVPSTRDRAVSAPVYLGAYEVYCHVYGEQAAMVEGGCRGGFSVAELLAFLYARAYREEWLRRVEEAFLGMKGL